VLTARRPPRAYLLSPRHSPPSRVARFRAETRARPPLGLQVFNCTVEFIFVSPRPNSSVPPLTTSSLRLLHILSHSGRAGAPSSERASPVTARAVAAGGPAPVPHREHAAQSSTAMTIVVTVVPKAARDALRLLELKRFSWRVDAEYRRMSPTRRAHAEAVRRRSVCRQVSERKDLSRPGE
jgi:hypothetical protein